MKTAELLGFEPSVYRKERKDELIYGVVYEATELSLNHKDIILNIAYGLRLNKRVESGYKIRGADLRIYIPEIESSLCPDIVVIEGEGEWFDENNHILLNPYIIFEILSPASETIDRSIKKDAYEIIESLVEFLLVSPDEMRVERYAKNAHGKWNAPVVYKYRYEEMNFNFSALMVEEIYLELKF